MASVYPDINGVRHDYSCVTVVVNGLPYRGVKSISYSDMVEPGDVYGTGAQRVGRTRGQHKCEGSIELYEDEWRDMLTSLLAVPVIGYMEVPFLINVAYQKTTLGTMLSDVLYGCRIKKVSSDRSEGNDALTTKLDLDIMRIERGGKQALTGMLL